jgi:tetratricopeptide (TPR) repeat protein
LYHANFINKNEGFSLDQLLEKYNEVETVIDKNSIAFPKKAEDFKNAKRACKSLVKDNLTPENLIPMAEKKFEANSKNTEWLATTANLLSDKCASSPIFGKIATQLHQLQPSSKSAYHLGNYNLKNRNIKQAVDYFDQSATLSTDKSEKAKTYNTIATIIAATDKAAAKKMILSAIENEPKNGTSYLFLANLYSNSITECGTSPLVKKAIYLLANQTAQKAAEVEPRLKATADQLAKEYAKNSPTKTELEQIQKAGGKVIIGCWIEETVQF